MGAETYCLWTVSGGGLFRVCFGELVFGVVAVDLNTLNITGFLQRNQCPSDMADGCFYAFGYVGLSSKVMNFQIAPHPIAKRSSGELMQSWASRSTPASWRMFGIGNRPKKNLVEGMNFVDHHSIEFTLCAVPRLEVTNPFCKCNCPTCNFERSDLQ